MPATPNYGFIYPTPGTEEDTWGAILNTLFIDVDEELKRVEDSIPSGGGSSHHQVFQEFLPASQQATQDADIVTNAVLYYNMDVTGAPGLTLDLRGTLPAGKAVRATIIVEISTTQFPTTFRIRAGDFALLLWEKRTSGVPSRGTGDVSSDPRTGPKRMFVNILAWMGSAGQTAYVNFDTESL